MTTEDKELFVAIEVHYRFTPQESFIVLSKPLEFEECKRFILELYETNGEEHQYWFMKEMDARFALRHSN